MLNTHATKKIHPPVHLPFSRQPLSPALLLRCLQTIYRRMGVANQRSGEMIMALSELLSYAVYETNVAIADAEKEEKSLQQLIFLEQENYGGHLAVDVHFACRPKGCIRPGMLIRLVEDCIALFYVAHGFTSMTIQLKVKERFIMLNILLAGHAAAVTSIKAAGFNQTLPCPGLRQLLVTPVAGGVRLKAVVNNATFASALSHAHAPVRSAFDEMNELKEKIHPHFLFNTLNNIYAFTMDEPHRAARYLMRLYRSLRYMIDDAAKMWVPLKNELDLITDYLQLEKLRYGRRLKVKLCVTGKFQHHYIAPLLMIPLVENCFKHGLSQLRGHLEISLKINISKGWLSLSLCNSKGDQPALSTKRQSTGLDLVRKRLSLIYPDKHQLKTCTYPNRFQLNLSLCLAKNDS